MKARSSNQWLSAMGVAAVAVAAIALGGLALMLVLDSGSGQSDPANQAQTSMDAPGFVASAPQDVQMAYQFALDRPDIMMWIPCYCGCGGHSGHRNARDCFIKAGSSSTTVQFEEHGSGCQVCVDIALMARSLTNEGRPLREIRAAVDAKYKGLGPATDTPLPPF